MSNINNIEAYIAQCFAADPVATAAHLYCAIGDAERKNIETGLNRKSLVVTESAVQSKTNAAAELIVDNTRLH